jgi:hypothetical protein
MLEQGGHQQRQHEQVCLLLEEAHWGQRSSSSSRL